MVRDLRHHESHAACLTRLPHNIGIAGLDREPDLAGMESVEEIPCVGLMGVVRLTAGPYALLITSAETVARLPQGGHAWVVTGVRGVPLTEASRKIVRGMDLTPWEAKAVGDDNS